MGKINSKKTVAGGLVFDSETEAQYYLYLTNNPDVEHIELQPQYVLLEPFNIRCNKCKGEGTMPSPKTGRVIKCKPCEGTGKRKRRGISYHADFKVTYMNGEEEVIDVKGYANERFPMVKKLFEYKKGQELVVIKKKGKEWVRD